MRWRQLKTSVSPSLSKHRPAAAAGACGSSISPMSWGRAFQAAQAEAKAQAKAGLLMGLESVQARCDHLARQLMIYGRPVDAAEIVAEIDRCDLDRVRSVASRMLAGPMAEATVGHRLAKAA